MKIFVYQNSLLTNVHGLTLFDAQARKTESSLLKIRQGAQRRAGASSDVSDHNVSDTDKICMQLFLDIQVNMVLVSNCSVLLLPPPPPLFLHAFHFILDIYASESDFMSLGFVLFTRSMGAALLLLGFKQLIFPHTVPCGNVLHLPIGKA